MEIFDGRHSAQIEGDFVVFLIGTRLNRWRSIWTFKKVVQQMFAMQSELRANPRLGCLHVENWASRTTIATQYWRSFEQLENYSRSTDAQHLPAWTEFNQMVRDNGDIGIWHETFKVRAGEYEVIYGNMPKFGMGAAGAHAKLGKASTAALRAGTRYEDEAPVEGY